MFIATKIPPKNMRWPATRDRIRCRDVYPPDHIRAYTEKSLENLGVETIDLQQFHVWTDAWADDDSWQRAFAISRTAGSFAPFGISVNRWEPTNVLRALGTGLIDSVQVVYNIFDQSAEDELFPYCQEHGIAIIARVPFDEGGLTGTLTPDSHWPEGDWRNLYFTPERLQGDAGARRTARAAAARRHGPARAGAALHPRASGGLDDDSGHAAASATSSGTCAASDGEPLPPRLRDALRAHRWDRVSDVP